MKFAFLLAITALQLFAQTAGSTPKIVYEEVVKNDPGLLPCHDFDAQIGKPIHPFDFQDLTGRHWRSSELRGKVVYLNIWFIGCPPCIQEIPSLNTLFNELGGKSDIVMLSIASDQSEVLKKFLVTNPIKLPVASVPFEQIKQLASVGGVIGYPTHLIIDRQGNLAVASRGGSGQILKELRYSLNMVASQSLQAINE
jgi:thiol-disulfide isomerase/thioredoxin